MLFSDFRNICFDDEVIVHVKGFEGSLPVKTSTIYCPYENLTVLYVRTNKDKGC